MGFLASLRDFLAEKAHIRPSEGASRRLRDAWGLSGDEPPAAAATSSAPSVDAQAASAYDRAQWRRKLHHVFEKDPADNPEWPALRREAKALNLGDAWIDECMREEFTMLIRSHVADRRLSDDERAELDAVRRRIGWSEEQAAAIVESVVAEARSFFGEDVDAGE